MWKECYEIQDYLVKIRRELHKIPELDTNLPQTAAIIKRELRDMGICFQQNKLDSGIVALIHGKGPGHCVALRADMDALPIREETGLPFASTNGCMHACGHDAHAAILLGAAKILQAHKNDFCGCVKFIFQTGEEGCHGAHIMIEEGVLENPHVNCILGLHIGSIHASEVGLGDVAIVSGPVMASNDHFTLIVKGTGCHGSTPEKGVDPIAITATIISALQQIVSREISATDPAVISIGKIIGGHAFNVIPDEVVLEGNIRAFRQEIREYLSNRIHEISKGIAHASRAQIEYYIETGAPPVINDAAITKIVQGAARRVVEEKHIITKFHAPNMGGEDMAHYLTHIPGTFFFLGSNNPDKHTDIPHHNSRFDIDEDVMWKGSCVFVESVMDLLKQ